MKFSRTQSIFFGIVCISAAFMLLVIPFIHATHVSAETVEERKAALQAQLDDVEKQIAEQQTFLNQTRQQTASISRDISILDAEIKQAQLKIKAHDIAINKLGQGITTKQAVISGLEESIIKGKASLSELLRQTNQMDDVSLVEIILANKSLANFFDDVESFNAIKQSVQMSLDEIHSLKKENEDQKIQLASERNDELDAKFSVEQEQKKIKAKEAQKQQLLSSSKNTEKGYQSLIASQQQKAAQIRAALFALRDTAAISFGKALQFANEAQKVTGIRPAFLLAILTQESDLGKNVGTCNRPGDPVSKQWRAIMPGPNDNSWRDDQTIFLQITKALGINPEGQPLSCPWQGGWGGAMGPAQFIPTTWQAYAPRIQAAFAKNVADPWNPEDAFLASALYLTDLGAGAGGYTAERTAALKYYAGGNWNLPKNAFYGDQVIRKANSIQTTMIDPLQGI